MSRDPKKVKVVTVKYPRFDMSVIDCDRL